MFAGDLRHRVTVQQATESRDANGGVTLTWSTFATVWAAINPLQGRELESAKAAAAETTHKVSIRYLSNLTSKMRISFGSRTLHILSVINPLEKNAELVLLCKESA